MQAWTQNRLNGRTKVRWECEELLPKEHVQSVNRRVSEVLVIIDLAVVVVVVVAALLGNAEIAARFRDVYLVPLHGSVVAMVTVVRNLPAEVRGPQRSVDNLEYSTILAAVTKPSRDISKRPDLQSQQHRKRSGWQKRRRGRTGKTKAGMNRCAREQPNHEPHGQ